MRHGLLLLMVLLGQLVDIGCTEVHVGRHRAAPGLLGDKLLRRYSHESKLLGRGHAHSVLAAAATTDCAGRSAGRAGHHAEPLVALGGPGRDSCRGGVRHHARTRRVWHSLERAGWGLKISQEFWWLETVATTI